MDDTKRVSFKRGPKTASYDTQMLKFRVMVGNQQRRLRVTSEVRKSAECDVLGTSDVKDRVVGCVQTLLEINQVI